MVLFDSVSAPRSEQHTNGKTGLPALIEGTIPLPSLLRLRSQAFLAQLYSCRRLSTRQIARMTEVSRSAVLASLDRCGIPQNGNGRMHPGQLPFGYEYLDYLLVENKAEQEMSRLIGQWRVGGQSLRQIARNLNQKFIPTKKSGIWQANTVRGILARA